MAKKKSHSNLSSLASALTLLVIAAVAGLVVYKQLFLGHRIAGSLPREALGQSLAQCARANYNPLPEDFAGSASAGVSGILSMVLQSVSGPALNLRLQQHLIDEIKVLRTDDFFGNNGQVRVTGSLLLAAGLPVVGDLTTRQNYLVTAHKQGERYSFSEVSIKSENQAQWRQWHCAGQF